MNESVNLGLLTNVVKSNIDLIVMQMTKVNRGHIGVFNSCFLPELLLTLSGNISTGKYNFKIESSVGVVSFMDCWLINDDENISEQKPEYSYHSNEYHVRIG